MLSLIYKKEKRLVFKFGWNRPSGSGDENENMKSLQRQEQQIHKTDNIWSEKLFEQLNLKYS